MMNKLGHRKATSRKPTLKFRRDASAAQKKLQNVSTHRATDVTLLDADGNESQR